MDADGILLRLRECFKVAVAKQIKKIIINTAYLLNTKGKVGKCGNKMGKPCQKQMP
jgi:hypothetical protein